jgi:hypothetical protein
MTGNSATIESADAARLTLQNQKAIMCALCIILDAVDAPTLLVARSLARLRLTDAIQSTREVLE